MPFDKDVFMCRNKWSVSSSDLNKRFYEEHKTQVEPKTIVTNRRYVQYYLQL